MTKNLINYVSDQFSDGMISKVSSLIGENAGLTKTALSAALPTVLKGIINRGDTAENVASMKKFISDEKINVDMISGLNKSDYLSKGAGVVNYLFGSAKDTLLSNAFKRTGLSASSNSSLMSAIAPMAMSYVAKLASSENMSDAQLATYLDGQKDKLVVAASSRATETKTHAQTTSTSQESNSGGGGGFLKWLLPLLLIGAGLWWFMNKDKEAKNMDEPSQIEEGVTYGDDGQSEGYSADSGTSSTSDNNGQTSATARLDGTTDGSASGREMSTGVEGSTAEVSYSVDANGNLVDANGKIIAKAGEFSEKDGSYVDADGKKIGFMKKVGKAIGGAASKTAGAVAGAATKSAAKMKEVFTGIFKSKEKVGSTYSMEKIVFNDESHRIEHFSKGEVEGLAAALKELPDAKIQVQVHAEEGKDVSKKRANVIRDMLVTLGVNKKQISFKGMGDGDAARAAEGKVEIKVEQTVD